MARGHPASTARSVALASRGRTPSVPFSVCPSASVRSPSAAPRGRALVCLASRARRGPDPLPVSLPPVRRRRRVLDEGELAASYPSSHTMLAVAVAGMGAAYLYRRIPCRCRRTSPGMSLIGLATVTTLLRLEAGVHWLTDIVGGVLVGLVITFAYLAVCAALQKGDRTV